MRATSITASWGGAPAGEREQRPSGLTYVVHSVSCRGRQHNTRIDNPLQDPSAGRAGTHTHTSKPSPTYLGRGQREGRAEAPDSPGPVIETLFRRGLRQETARVTTAKRPRSNIYDNAPSCPFSTLATTNPPGLSRLDPTRILLLRLRFDGCWPSEVGALTTYLLFTSVLCCCPPSKFQIPIHPGTTSPKSGLLHA